MIFQDLQNTDSIENKLSIIERREIDSADLQFPGHLSFLSEFFYYRLRGKPSVINLKDENKAHDNIAETLLIGLYASKLPFCFITDVYPDHIEIYCGSKAKTSGEDSSVHKTIFEGYWGAEYLSQNNSINNRIRELAAYTTCGAVTGIPNPAVVSPLRKKIMPSDHWMRSLQRDRWTYLISGFPVQRDMLTEYGNQIISEIALLRTQTIREDILFESKRIAEHYQGLLEANLKRVESARLSGAWQIGMYFFADNESLIRQGLGIISSHFGGQKSVTQPIRTHLCYKNDSLKNSFSNFLITNEAAPLINLPDEEVPGYAIQKVAQFDTDFRGINNRESVVIGKILRNWMVSENKYTIDSSDLTKHTLIAGVTGSGKTTTCFNILRQLIKMKISFMVIESAKSEYRQLLNDPLFKEMLIFTLGDDTPGRSSPFRINPFEIPEGILIQTHLDYLKSLFRAGFVMYAPMPYVLEEALHEIYRDKGWNLSSNANHRGASQLAFPTLTNLYEKIDEVVSRLGYDERISKDILAGLKTRINNLRLGGKGMMLDTYRSTPIDELMKRPVLLELKRLGSDEEKAFIIGLVLMRIYEYYESKPEITNNNNTLRHLTLIEEAHRLLKHVPEESSDQDGNVRGKAVETFCNILSEIRAYGEGVLVSEQIPTKLARDVLKNTNLKVMHRIVARDDRDIMGDTMNLTEEQKIYATTLEKGRAIVFAEGMDTPFLIYVPIDSLVMDEITNKPVSDKTVYLHMSDPLKTGSKLLSMSYVCELCHIDKMNCNHVRETIKSILSDRSSREIFNRLFLMTLLEDISIDTIEDINRIIREKSNIKTTEELKSFQLCFITQASALIIEDQGRMYDYPYEKMEDLIKTFVSLMKQQTDNKAIDNINIEEFRENAISLRTRFEPPFTGCFICNSICLYRYELSHYLRNRDINLDFNEISKIKDSREMWIVLAEFCEKVSKRLIRKHNMHTALCFLSQMVAKRGYAPLVQKKIILQVKRVMAGKGI